MEAKELLLIIRNHVDKLTDSSTTPIMYDPDKMQYKVSFGTLENYKDGVIKRFVITVEDHLPRQY